MALLWADGFDHYGTSPNGGRDAMLAGAWAQFRSGVGSNPQISTSNPRTGAASLYIPAGSGWNGTATPFARRIIGVNGNVVGVGFGLHLGALPEKSDGVGVQFWNVGGTAILSIYVGSDGSLIVRNGQYNSTILGSSDPGVITASAYNHVEMKILFDDIVGTVELHVNGVTVLSLTNQALSATAPASVLFGLPTRNSGDTITSFTSYWDDIVCWDDSGDINNDFIGPARVTMIFPVADTVVDDWVPTGASDSYDCVDEVPPDGDTTFITAAVVDDTSEFELDDMPPETEMILGVYIPIMAKLDDAGVGTVNVSLVSNGQAAESVDIPLTTAYTYWGRMFQLDPDTESYWTKESLSSALLRLVKSS